MSYQSPIEIIQEQVQTGIENEVLKTVINVGVDVDKEELIKALAYDRNQYTKGYNDRDSEIVRCKDCVYFDPENAEEGDSYGRCRNNYAPCQNQQVEMMWFCADGERKEGR